MDLDKDKEKDTETTEENEETPKETLSTSEWLLSLAEANKDDIDFVQKVHETMSAIETKNTSNDLVQENERLKEELKKSKDKFYEAFLKGRVDTPKDVTEEEETKTPSLEDILTKMV